MSVSFEQKQSQPISEDATDQLLLMQGVAGIELSSSDGGLLRTTVKFEVPLSELGTSRTWNEVSFTPLAWPASFSATGTGKMLVAVDRTDATISPAGTIELTVHVALQNANLHRIVYQVFAVNRRRTIADPPPAAKQQY